MEHDRIHVLYIDDDPATVRLAEKRLIRAGYKVDTANNGETGLQLFQKGNYDVIALDYRMPIYDGLEVIRKLTAQDITSPIIMVTGSGDEKTAVKAMKMGASDYITKDGGDGYLDLLPTVIEQVLQKQRLQQERQNALDTLRRRNHDLALLHRISQMITATLNLQQVIEQLLQVEA